MSHPTDPVSPIVIVPLDGGRRQEPRRVEPPDMRHWQIKEFLRQTGKSENTQWAYRGQLVRFAAWCDRSWLDVTPSDIGKYRRELKRKVEGNVSESRAQYAQGVLWVAETEQWLSDESAFAHGCDRVGTSTRTSG